MSPHQHHYNHVAVYDGLVHLLCWSGGKAEYGEVKKDLAIVPSAIVALSCDWDASMLSLTLVTGVGGVIVEFAEGDSGEAQVEARDAITEAMKLKEPT